MLHAWKGGRAVLKVVIADDEARILSLIRLLPDWDALGMEVALSLIHI